MKKLTLLLLLLGLNIYAGETGFLLFGDTGTGESPQYQVARGMEQFCKDQKCDFVTLLGDNFYPTGVNGVRDTQWQTAFEAPYQNLDMPFYVALGNHDYLGDVEAQIKYTEVSDKWYLPSRYYSFSRGDIDFFVVDTNDFDSTQQSWLKKALKKSKKPWKIAFGHHPIYSNGSHGGSQDLQENLLPLLEGQIDLYLCGHDHSRQVIEKKSSDITFIVSGAGAKGEPVRGSRKSLFDSDKLGFAHLLVTKSKAILKMLDQNGAVEYQYTLNH
jgi:tartrate-resistant acid phosphatase type 5